MEGEEAHPMFIQKRFRSTTTTIILDTLPWSGVSAVILAIIVVKVAELLSGLFSDKVNDESDQK